MHYTDRVYQRIRALLRQTPGSFYILPVVVFVATPAVIASQNEIGVLSISLWMWVRLSAFGVLILLILIAVNRMLGDNALGGAFRLLVTFTAFFVVCSGFLLPLSVNRGLVDVNQAGVDERNVVLCLILATGMLTLSESRFRNSIVLYVGLFVVGNLGWAIISVGHEPGLPIDGETTAASSTQNVFVVSFDGLSGSAVSQVILDDPELQEALAGFVVFEGVASSSPATSASIAAELYGNRDFKRNYSTNSELWNSDPTRLLTNVLARSGYGVATYGEYARNLADTGVTLNSEPRLNATAHTLMRASIGRTLSRAFVPNGAWDRELAEFLSYLDAPPGSDLEFLEAIQSSPIPDWSKALTPAAIDFTNFVDHLSVRRTEPMAFFLHFTHTHYPIQFDEACAFRADDPEWFSRNQNRDGDLSQSRCAALQLAAFVGKVERLGILDQSMIVLKSDHGKPIYYTEPGGIEATTIRDHPFWGFSRYAPFLAVKPFGQGHQDSTGPVWDTSPVLLDDLARTICDEAEIAYDCKTFPGYNIVRERPPPDSAVTLFVVQSESSDFRYDTHEAITFARGASILEGLRQALLGQDGPITADTAEALPSHKGFDQVIVEHGG